MADSNRPVLLWLLVLLQVIGGSCFVGNGRIIPRRCASCLRRPPVAQLATTARRIFALPQSASEETSEPMMELEKLPEETQLLLLEAALTSEGA